MKRQFPWYLKQIKSENTPSGAIVTTLRIRKIFVLWIKALQAIKAIVKDIKEKTNGYNPYR